MNLPLILMLALAGQAAAGADTPSEKTPPASGRLIKLPKLIRYVEAPYPPEAAAEGREGVVVLALDVDAQGVVQRVELLESSGLEAFDRGAMAAAAGFSFTPAEAEGYGPVPVRITYRYGFVLESPGSEGADTATVAASQGRIGPPPPPPPINFSGTVKEAGARSPVPFARVTVSISTTATTTRTSTEAHASGRFAFRGLPAGKHVVAVTAPLFERLDTKERIETKEALEVLYYLDRAARNPYEVVVRAKRPRKEVARRTLQFEEIQRLPGTQGDAIRVVQNLPGVSRAPFGLGLLVVRGAPPQDTGVYLDGHLLPILFHFGGAAGVTSVVNARMLESIDFFPGGFGPEQGRVSAGAVQLQSRFAATDRVHGEAVLDLAGASVFVEGPVSSDDQDGAFVLALRRSYIDGIVAGVISATDSDVALAPRYYDYQARWDKPLGDRTRMLTILLYGSDDELLAVGSPDDAGVAEGTQLRTYFHRINPRFTYQPDADTKLVLSPIVGLDFTNTETYGDPSGNDFRFRLEDWNAGFRLDTENRLAPWAVLRAGGDLLFFRFSADTALPALPSTRDFPSPVSTDAPLREDQAVIPAMVSSLYAELELKPLENLTLWPGVRFDLYDFQADSQTLVDPRLVEGRTDVGVDPRITARYRVNGRLDLKGHAGLYQQPPLPTQYFVNADLPLQRTGQYGLGFEWQIVDRLSLDLQGFLRLQGRVPRFSGDTEILEDGTVRLVGFRPEGQRRAFGAELLLKLEKRWGLFGWVAYTLSRSAERREDEEWATNLFFDQTHNLNIVASYELGLNWFLSLRFRYVTGGGSPRYEARWYDADRDAYSAEVANERKRAPAFHQLDLRIDKRWVFDEWYFELYLDVLNVYNHKNTEFLAPTFDFKEEIPIPSLPFFPVIGFKGVF